MAAETVITWKFDWAGCSNWPTDLVLAVLWDRQPAHLPVTQACGLVFLTVWQLGFERECSKSECSLLSQNRTSEAGSYWG